MLRPSIQPKSRKPSRNAFTRPCASGSFSSRAKNHAYAPHPLWLLRPCCERRRDRRTAKKRDELAPSHCLPRGSGLVIVAAQTCGGNAPGARQKHDLMSALGQSRHLQCKRSCPLYPRKRILAAHKSMSALSKSGHRVTFQRNELGRPRGHRSHHLILFGADL